MNAQTVETIEDTGLSLAIVCGQLVAPPRVDTYHGITTTHYLVAVHTNSPTAGRVDAIPIVTTLDPNQHPNVGIGDELRVGGRIERRPNRHVEEAPVTIVAEHVTVR